MLASRQITHMRWSRLAVAFLAYGILLWLTGRFLDLAFPLPPGRSYGISNVLFDEFRLPFSPCHFLSFWAFAKDARQKMWLPLVVTTLAFGVFMGPIRHALIFYQGLHLDVARDAPWLFNWGGAVPSKASLIWLISISLLTSMCAVVANVRGRLLNWKLISSFTTGFCATFAVHFFYVPAMFTITFQHILDAKRFITLSGALPLIDSLVLWVVLALVKYSVHGGAGGSERGTF